MCLPSGSYINAKSTADKASKSSDISDLEEKPIGGKRIRKTLKRFGNELDDSSDDEASQRPPLKGLLISSK